MQEGTVTEDLSTVPDCPAENNVNDLGLEKCENATDHDMSNNNQDAVSDTVTSFSEPGQEYSDDDIIEGLDQSDDSASLLPRDISPRVRLSSITSDEETNELIAKLNDLVNKDLLSDAEHQELETLLLMLTSCLDDYFRC